MKRRIAVIVLALVMCLFAVGCEETPAPAAPDYKLEAVANIDCVIGETPDWSKGLKLTVNGEEVPIDNSAVVFKLTSGVEGEVGQCRYAVSITYNGVEVVSNKAVVVKYKKASGEDPIIPVEDKTNMTAAQLAELRAALTKSYNSFDFVYINADFSSTLTVEERYQTINDAKSGDIAYYECDKKVKSGTETIASPKWYLRNYNDLQETVEADKEMFAIYRNDWAEADKHDWIKRSVTSRYFAQQAAVNNSDLKRFYPYSFSINEIAFDAEWFDIENDGSYSVRPFNVSNAFDELYEGIRTELQIVPYSITLRLVQGNVKSIECEVAYVGSGTSVETSIKFEWSNFDSAKVNLPEGGNVPEIEMDNPGGYITPDGASEISNATALATALEADYKKMTCVYKDDREVITEQRCELEDSKLHYKSESYYFGTQSSNNGIIQIADDSASTQNKVTVSESEAYFNIDGTNGATIYLISDEYGNYRKYLSSSLKSIDDMSLYTPKALPLDVAWFGSKENKYVIKSDYLQSATAALKNVLGFGQLYSCELVAFTAEMNQSNQIVGFDMMLKYKETKNEVADYWRFTITYEKIGDTTVIFPAGGNTPLSEWTAAADAQTKFANAIKSENFTNVTVTDTLFAYSDASMGVLISQNVVTKFQDNRTTHVFMDQYMGIPFLTQYDFEREQRAVDNKKEYVYVRTGYTDTGYAEEDYSQETYDYTVPYFHFEAITTEVMERMMYDPQADAFVLSKSADFNLKTFLKSFLPYANVVVEDVPKPDSWYDALVFTFNKDGKLDTIRLLTVEEMQDSETGERLDVTDTYCFMFSDYGETETVFDYEREAVTSAATIDQLESLTKGGFTADNYAELKEYIERALKDYAEYTEKGKALVTNYSKLTAIKAKLDEFEAQIAQDAKDHKDAIDNVIGKIDALPSTITKNNRDAAKAAIDAARAAYDELGDLSKLSVSNYSDLVYAERALAAYDYNDEITAVYNKIEELTSNITATNHDKIKADTAVARTAYDALTASAKLNVSNYTILRNVERALVAYENRDAIDAVVDLIDSLPEKITEKNYDKAKNDIAAARAAYDGLANESIQANVSNYNTLLYAERLLIQYEEAQAA